ASRYAAVAGAPPTPVLRLSATVSGGGGATSEVTALGVPHSTLRHLGGWRRDFSSASPSKLAAVLTPPVSPRLAGPALPPAARTLRVRTRTRGDAVGLTARIASGDRILSVSLGSTGPRARDLVARLPRLVPGARVVAVEIA